VSDNHLFVGESAHRESTENGRLATIAMISRKDWQVVHRFHLPAREVYDIVICSPELAKGLHAGFRTNATRVIEQDQLSMFRTTGVSPSRLWASGDPMKPEECLVDLQLTPPEFMEAGAQTTLIGQLANRGPVAITSAPPFPVRLSYRWFRLGTRELVLEGDRTSLPVTLFPQQDTAMRLALRAPSESGVYDLSITLVQEQVAWFDDISPGNGLMVTIVVDDNQCG
jgi:hypothetical protein